MNILADECIDRQIVEHLRVDGHDVVYIAELDPGIADDVVLTQANERHAESRSTTPSSHRNVFVAFLSKLRFDATMASHS